MTRKRLRHVVFLGLGWVFGVSMGTANGLQSLSSPLSMASIGPFRLIVIFFFHEGHGEGSTILGVYVVYS